MTGAPLAIRGWTVPDWAARALRAPTTPLLVLFLLLLIVGGSISPNFLGTRNVTAVSDFVLGLLIVALGSSISALGGVIDLSIGSMLGLSATVFALVFERTGSPWPAAAAAIGSGVAVGSFNGFLSVRLGVSPLVATLPGLVGLRGLELVLDHNTSIPSYVPDWSYFVGTDVGPFPILFLIVLAIYLLAALAIAQTRPGRHLRATGGQPASAGRAGIPTGRIQFCLFLITSVSAALGGIVQVAQLGSAPATLGTGLELQVFAAILLGGFSVTSGGVGSLTGTVLGALMLASLSDLLDLANVVSFWQQIVVGAVLLAAVYVDNRRRHERFM